MFRKRKALESQLEFYKFLAKETADIYRTLRGHYSKLDGIRADISATETLSEWCKLAEGMLGKSVFILDPTPRGHVTKELYINESISLSWRNLPEDGKLTFSIKSDGKWYPEYLLFGTEEEAISWALQNKTPLKFSKKLAEVLKKEKFERVPF